MAVQFWEFPVQWAEAFTVVTAYKTEIISSYNGKEQRRAMRAYPRRSFSFKLDALPDVVDEVQFFLTTAQRNTVVMPEVVRRQRTITAIFRNTGTVQVDGVPEWMAVGSYVALVGSRRVEVKEIIAVVGNLLSFSEASSNPWPKNTRIVPAWEGLLSESISFQAPTSRVLQGTIEFAVNPGQDFREPPDVDVRNTLYDREVLPFEPNWSDPPEVSVVQERQIVDYGRGVLAMRPTVPYASRVYSFDVLGYKPADAVKLEDFFLRALGRQGDFYFAPPSRGDMIPALPQVAPGVAAIRLKGDAPRRAFVGDPTLRVLAVAMKNGLVHYRRVTAATAAGGDTLLTLDMDVPEIISSDGVKAIYWLSVSRFESDELTIDWQTTNVSTSRLSVRALEQTPSEQSFGFDEGLQWLIDYYGAAFAEDIIFDPLFRVLNDQEPRFALVVDGGTQYLIDTFGRDPSDRWVLDGLNKVLNTQEPRFAEA